MSAPSIPNPLSQCDRAIAAYFISLGIGTASNITPAHTTATKQYQNIIVKTYQSSQDIDLTGNDRVQIQIHFRQSAATTPNDTNPDAKRVALDTLVGQGMYAMIQSDDGSTLRATCAAINDAGRNLASAAPATPKNWASVENNADMANFTIQSLHYKGAARGEPEGDNGAWVEIRNFEATVCPSALG